MERENCSPFPSFLKASAPSKVVLVESHFKKIPPVGTQDGGFVQIRLNLGKELRQPVEETGARIQVRVEATMGGYAGQPEDSESANQLFECRVVAEMLYEASDSVSQEDMDAADEYFGGQARILAQNYLRSLLMYTDFFAVPIRPV